ncbi:MAG: hypothetical protein WCJ30_15005, partial [Deltaproteobacteria bacterium]
TLCGGMCSNTAVDPSNCGSCGHACAAGETCATGTCGLVCAGGATLCGSACTNTLVDRANCGTCGHACAAGETCVAGACGLSCVGGTTLCGSACTNTLVDHANCGTCGHACAAGEACAAGTCGLVCAGGTTQCAATCADTRIDPAHCGACGTACGRTQVCAASVCTCRIGDVPCGTACANLSTSSLNCGACGAACAANQVCSGGACATVALGNGGTGGSLTGSSPPRVAVMAAYSGATDLQAKLVATGAFSAVDVYTSLSAAPTLAVMRGYDAIVVYTYLTATTLFGDNLATYLEAGGGVVIADYETQETGTYGLPGRYQTQYTLSTPIASSAWSTTAVTLGTILEPASPLLNGVTTFAYGGTSPYHMPASAFNRNSPIVVAQYSDGNPAIVRGVIGGHAVVEINGFGSSSTYSSTLGWNAATDGARVFRNALLFTIPPVSVSVVRQQDFGTQAVLTASAPLAITYTNTSTAAQTITALALTGANIGDFLAVPTASLPVTIPPGGTFVVNATFAPSGLGFRAATLSATVTGAPTAATTLLTGTGN